MIIRAKTMREWIAANLTKGELKDITNHGADAGFSGITYYKDTCNLYAHFKDEIWNALVEESEGGGFDNPFEYMATWRGAKNVGSVDQFENLMVWYFVEKIASEEE